MSLRTRLGIDIDADSRGVDTGARRAGSSLSRMGRVGRSAALGIAGALTAAAAAGGALAASAAEDDLGQRRLAFQIEKVTDATDKQIASVDRWIDRQGKQLGVVDDDLRPALSKLVAATHDVGEAQDLASLAMDVSAATGKSLETVTMSLVRAQNGSTAGLSRLGVQTKDTEGNTLSLERVTKKLSDTYSGSAAAAADTAAGRYGRLKVQLGELGERIGSKVLPYASRLGNWLLDAIPVAQHLANRLGRTLGPALSAVGDFIRQDVIPQASRFYEWFVEKIAPGLKRTVQPVLKGVREFLEKISDKLVENKDKFKEAAEFVADKVLPAFGELAEDTLPKMGEQLGVVVDGLGFLADHLEDAWNWAVKLNDALDKLNVNVPGTDSGLLDLVQDALPGIGGLTRATVPQVSDDAAALAGSSSTTTIDASLTLNVDGSGIVDENRIAQVLAPVLERHAQRLGNLPRVAIA